MDTDEVNRSNRLEFLPPDPMTEEENHQTEYHLQEAFRHLQEAQNGSLSQTNTVAIETVADTVARVLREYKLDE